MAAPLVAAAAAPPLTPAKKPPSDPIEYKEMERKLNQWKSEISKKRQAFTDQSVKVKEWDNALVRNNEQIMKLQKEVNNVKVHQHRLSEQLKGIKSHQETIRAVVQEHAKKAAEVPQPPPDEGREKTYKMAEKINSQLVHASGDLNEIIKGLNAQEVDSAQDDAVDDMARISKILGAHVDTLSWVEKRTDTLNTRIVALESSRQQIAYPNQPMQGFQ
jgi:nuclear pore complex protein Nup62